MTSATIDGEDAADTSDVRTHGHVSVQEYDLRQFLKVANPDWTMIRKGRVELDRVMDKLNAIGVSDIRELMRRVQSNRINMDLFQAGYPCFSDSTLESLRKRNSFLTALDHMTEPFYRQTGLFAPAPQMVARTNLWCAAKQSNPKAVKNTCILDYLTPDPVAAPRPSTAPEVSRSGGAPPTASSAAGRHAPSSSSAAGVKSKGNATAPGNIAGRPCSASDCLPRPKMRYRRNEKSWRQRSCPDQLQVAKTPSLDSAWQQARDLQQVQKPLESRPLDLSLPRRSSACASSVAAGGRQSVVFANLPGIETSPPPTRPGSAAANSPTAIVNGSDSAVGSAAEVSEVQWLTDALVEEERSVPPGLSSPNSARFLTEHCATPSIRKSKGILPTPTASASSANRARLSSSTSVDRRNSKGAASSAGHARRVSKANSTWGSEASAELEDKQLEIQVEHLQQAGAAMRAGIRCPKWSSLRSDTLLGHGDAMLREQAALDDKRKFFENMLREGKHSATRHLIAASIRCRLKDEKHRDAKCVLDMNTSCTAIRNHFQNLQKSRRELGAVREQAEKLLGRPPQLLELARCFTDAGKRTDVSSPMEDD